MDNRQDHMNVFAMVREGMAFLERTMPLGARFPQGKIFREVWGRGTNRVIAACEKHGAAPPVFEERQGFLVVTFGA